MAHLHFVSVFCLLVYVFSVRKVMDSQHDTTRSPRQVPDDGKEVAIRIKDAKNLKMSAVAAKKATLSLFEDFKYDAQHIVVPLMLVLMPCLFLVVVRVKGASLSVVAQKIKQQRINFHEQDVTFLVTQVVKWKAKLRLMPTYVSTAAVLIMFGVLIIFGLLVLI